MRLQKFEIGEGGREVHFPEGRDYPKGAIYERVERGDFGEAWRGPDGVIWSDFAGYATHLNAQALCKEIGGELPLESDFHHGRKNAFEKVLPNFDERWYWSSNLNDSENAFGYSGDWIFWHDHSVNYVESVRCVAR